MRRLFVFGALYVFASSAVAQDGPTPPVPRKPGVGTFLTKTTIIAAPALAGSLAGPEGTAIGGAAGVAAAEVYGNSIGEKADKAINNTLHPVRVATNKHVLGPAVQKWRSWFGR